MNLLMQTLVTCSKTKVFSLLYSALTGGSITGTASQQVKKGKSGEEVTAVADPDFIFLKWNDDLETASRTDESVQANLSLEAIFDSTLPPMPLVVANVLDWSVT